MEGLKLYILMLYTIPFFRLRYVFRGLVYEDFSNSINYRPVFWKEVKALFSNKYFKSRNEIRLANFYRAYVVGYLLLLI